MTNVQPLKAMNLDKQQQLEFINFYEILPKKSPSTVRFFQHSDFYSVHEEDATLAANQVFSTNVIKEMGHNNKLLSYVCLSQNNFELFIRELLLIMQYRVEMYEKAPKGWSLTHKASPGNLKDFEDLLLEAAEDIVISSNVMGVNLKSYNLGICCVSSIESEITVAEFNDNEFFTELEALIAKINPKECVIPTGNTPDLCELRKILERNDVIIVQAKKDQFDQTNIDQDLNKLLYFAENQQRSSVMLPERALTSSMCALQAVINFLNLVNEEEKHNQFKLSVINFKQYVRLDNAALYSLNLISKPMEKGGDKNETVFGVLNNCCTPQGKRLLDKWIKQPLRDANLINERLNAVQTLIGNSELRNKLMLRLRMPDLLILAKKLSSQRAGLKDCYRIYQALENVHMIVDIEKSNECESVKSLIVNPIVECLNEMARFEAMIETTISLDLVDRGEFFVKPSQDEALEELYKSKLKLEECIQKLFMRCCKDLGFDAGKTMKLECNDQHGYYYRVTLKEEPTLRANKKFKIIDAVKGGVRFNDEKLQEFNADYREIKENYEKLQETIVRKIINVAAGYAPTVKNLNYTVAVADVLISFAITAVNAPLPYVRPQLLPEGSGIIRLKQVRHPCLERLKQNCIPNDVDFVKDKSSFKIITGPNMGGKSTFMRSVAICTLMAQIGSFVPCEEAEISLVDSILTRVGADDSDLKGMSTFMMEMVDTNGIIRSVTPNSLVVIDELGRGTSTFDGCGIAWAIAKYLAGKVQPFSLFATHYHELTRLQDEIPIVSNLHVTAIIDNDRIVPLFQVKDGSCDKSYGIHCAKAAGFPDDVLMAATEYQEQLEASKGVKYIKHLHPSDQQKIIEEGDELIEKALKKLKEEGKPVESNKELFLELVKSSGNLFIKGLLE